MVSDSRHDSHQEQLELQWLSSECLGTSADAIDCHPNAEAEAPHQPKVDLIGTKAPRGLAGPGRDEVAVPRIGSGPSVTFLSRERFTQSKLPGSCLPTTSIVPLLYASSILNCCLVFPNSILLHKASACDQILRPTPLSPSNSLSKPIPTVPESLRCPPQLPGW